MLAFIEGKDKAYEEIMALKKIHPDSPMITAMVDQIWHFQREVFIRDM